MLKPFGLSIFFYRTKTILSTKNIRKYTHEYATSISQNSHICCAKYSHSNTKYIATNLQQHNIQKTKTILLQCKNHTFARQKGGFYTPKNPFLFFVSITNTLLMCYEYSVKWLRTFHKMRNETHETPNEHPRNVQRTIREMSTKHTARRRGRFIAPVSLHYQKCIFPLPKMRLHSPFCGYIHICGHDKSAPTAADGLPIMLQTDCNNVANIPQNAHETLR